MKCLNCGVELTAVPPETDTTKAACCMSCWLQAYIRTEEEKDQ